MTPKYNPKHQKKKTGPSSTKSAKKYLRNKKVTTWIIITVVVGVSIVGIFMGKLGYDEWALNHIQKGDTVTAELRIWKADDDGNNISLVVWHDNVTIHMEETALESDIVYGLWDQLHGMAEGDTREKLWLSRCVDDLIPIPDVEFYEDAVAGDGWDDRYRPGRSRARCQSFGTWTNGTMGVELRFTPIIYWINIVELVKGN